MDHSLWKIAVPSADPELKKFLTTAIETRSMFMLESAIQMILVKHGNRKAWLWESANFNDELPPDEQLQTLKPIIESFGMRITKDSSASTEFPRYFISSDTIGEGLRDNEIAEILGFKCSGHDYGNQSLNRTTFLLDMHWKKMSLNIRTEACESSKINKESMEKMYQKEAEEMQNTLRMYMDGASVVVNVKESFSVKTRVEKVMDNDIDFVVQNGDEYINDFYNNNAMTDFMDELLSGDKELLEKYWKIFKRIYLGIGSIPVSEKGAAKYRQNIDEAEERLKTLQMEFMQLLSKYEDLL